MNPNNPGLRTRHLCVLAAFFSGIVLASNAHAQGETLKTGLVSYWPLDIVQGTKTPDLKSGYDMNLVNLTAADLVAGHTGSCFQFDNARQTLLKRSDIAGEGLPIANKPSFTVSLWAKVNFSGQSDRRLFSEGSATTTDPLFNLGTHNGGSTAALDILIRNTGTTTVDHPKTTAQPFDGQDWHHILFVQTLQPAGDSTRQVYIDNTLDGIVMINRPAGSVYSFNLTSIGGIQRATPSAWVTGLIDDVAVWNRALTEAEIADLYTNGIPPLTPPLEPLKITKFDADFPVTVEGKSARLSWDVTKDATITITPGIGDVTAQSAFGVGKTDIPLAATTVFTLTASRGAEPPVQRTLTLTAKTGVTPGWEWLEDFQGRNIGNLAAQGHWLNGDGNATVAAIGTNRAAKVTAGGDLLALPLLSRTLLETRKATLFFRFCYASAQPALAIDILVGLSEKSPRGSADFATNVGTYVHFARAADGPLTIEARNGIGAGYEPAAYEFVPGQVYNVWVDVMNEPLGSTDTFSVHVAAEGEPRATLFDNYSSDREPQEVLVLGSPLPDIHFLFMTAITAAQAMDSMVFDDFYLSSGDSFNTTVPVPSAFGKAPLTSLVITGVQYEKTTGKMTLEWTSRPGEVYSVWSSLDLVGWSEAASGVASGGATTTVTLPGSFTGPAAYFEIRR